MTEIALGPIAFAEGNAYGLGLGLGLGVAVAEAEAVGVAVALACGPGEFAPLGPCVAGLPGLDPPPPLHAQIEATDMMPKKRLTKYMRSAYDPGESNGHRR